MLFRKHTLKPPCFEGLGCADGHGLGKMDRGLFHREVVVPEPEVYHRQQGPGSKLALDELSVAVDTLLKGGAAQW